MLYFGWVWRKLVGCTCVGVVLSGWVKRCVCSVAPCIFVFLIWAQNLKDNILIKKCKASLLLLLWCSYEDDLRKPSLLLVRPDAFFIHSNWHNLLWKPNPHPIICQNKMKTYEELWLLGCRTWVLEALWILPDHPFQPHLGVIHLSRPSQAPLPPDELWNVYYAFAGLWWGDSVMDSTACANTALRSTNTNTTKQYYFIILGRI